METEKNGEQGKSNETKRKGTGEQYLYALIKCADWVDKPYKQLAEKNRVRPEVLKELYLCACDGVPIEKAIEAQEKNPPEGALKFLRRKFLESAATSEYQEQITGIKLTTSTLEKEVRQMSGMLKHIAEHVPDFDSMFPKETQQMLEQEIQSQEDVPKSGTQENEPEHVPEMNTQKHIQKDVVESGTIENGKKDVPKPGTQGNAQENVPKSGTKKNRNVWFPWERKRGPADFIEKLLEVGYSNEQLDYLLDCMEEGLPIEEIERFSSPKLPVEVMRRLRRLEERKEIEE